MKCLKIMDNRSSRRFTTEDYKKPCKELAINLLGKILTRKSENGDILMGKIVETECYLGGEDKASHSHNGKVTKRNEPMYMCAGTAYVYTLFFGYHCFNISSMEPGAVVLIRAVEPMYGMDIMKIHRASNNKSGLKQLHKVSKFCDGPSKLCICFDITKENSNNLDLADPNNNQLWIEECIEFEETIKIVSTARIGMGPKAEEWANKTLRYYILDNQSVSKRDRKAERGDLSHLSLI